MPCLAVSPAFGFACKLKGAWRWWFATQILFLANQDMNVAALFFLRSYRDNGPGRRRRPHMIVGLWCHWKARTSDVSSRNLIPLNSRTWCSWQEKISINILYVLIVNILHWHDNLPPNLSNQRVILNTLHGGLDSHVLDATVRARLSPEAGLLFKV